MTAFIRSVRKGWINPRYIIRCGYRELPFAKASSRATEGDLGLEVLPELKPVAIVEGLDESVIELVETEVANTVMQLLPLPAESASVVERGLGYAHNDPRAVVALALLLDGRIAPVVSDRDSHQVYVENAGAPSALDPGDFP